VQAVTSTEVLSFGEDTEASYILSVEPDCTFENIGPETAYLHIVAKNSPFFVSKQK
jgi:hypothetical protein